MSNFVPHDQYESYLSAQVDRVNKERLKWVKEERSDLKEVATIIIPAFFILMVLRLISGEGSLIYGLGGLALVGFGASKVWKSNHRFFNSSFNCPHCEHKIQLQADYQCGWCGHHQSVEQLSGYSALNRDPKSALDDCESCRRPMHSLMCPSCSNDIVFNIDSYNAAKKVGYGFEGTRKLI